MIYINMILYLKSFKIIVVSTIELIGGISEKIRRLGTFSGYSR